MTFLLAAVLGGAVLGAAHPAPDVVVVCPEEFRESLAPWLEHRERQGHLVELVEPRLSAEEVREQIRKVASRGRLQAVVLVGDVFAELPADPAGRAAVRVPSKAAWCVPTHLATAKVNVAWGSEPQIATDNWYADLDDDAVPDVAIGRLTADSPQDLERIVRKILVYEQSLNFGAWRSRVNFIAGVGGFGVLADAVLEAATRQVIAAGIPAAYTTTMTYGSWRSPYCPDPRGFHQTTLDRLNEGCLFWVYIGHGYRWYLDRVRTPAGEHHILDIRDMAKLQCTEGSPIALFLACYTAAFDGPYDCLAEELLRADGGPVAIIGGSRVTMPYAMAVLGTGMMDEFFHNRRETLGEVLLHAKRTMALPAQPTDEDDTHASIRQGLDAVAKALSPADPTEERIEHLHLLNLIGDPLLRLQQPHEVRVEAASEAAAGQGLNIAGQCDIDGPCTIEVVLKRGRMKQRAPDRSRFAANSAELAAYQNDYAAANDNQLCVSHSEVRNGKFSAQLQLPAEAHGQCEVRVFVRGAQSHALAAKDLEIVSPGKTAEASESLRR